jgi:hypothetical protein
VIYRYTDLTRGINWIPEDNPEAGDVAKRFLEGERELLRLERAHSIAIVPINVFLEIARDSKLNVERGVAGELLVRATDSGESLLLTGKTAEVLSSYIDGRPVSMNDRGDMTLRRRPE